MEGWDKGDPVVRRELLRTFFVEFDVHGGQVLGYRPQPEYAVDVMRCLEEWRPPLWP
jgi:hypothetical protein